MGFITNAVLIPSEHQDFLGNHHPDRPLPAGSIIDYCGDEVEVAFDDGGETIEIFNQNGSKEEIYWDLADVMCTVVSVNVNKEHLVSTA